MKEAFVDNVNSQPNLYMYVYIKVLLV